MTYTPDMAGSGQYGICAQCNLPPTDDGHDGCLGTLPEKKSYERMLWPRKRPASIHSNMEWKVHPWCRSYCRNESIETRLEETDMTDTCGEIGD